MAIFRCKMCGGDLEITEGLSVCTCEFCGTEQTLPRLDSDRKANLYDRANHFRRNNDFDKAMGIYEQILNEDNTDAEAYWSLVLCRYGIEYVEDPSTHKRIPTINRAQYTSIYADENYKAALEHAAAAQKIVYEQEAKTIDEIQKGILAISEKEEPFDVFICYKESDENGRRTPDSVLANDLYHQLFQEGFKVFFARITLEDKLGQEYEPYIFAALNSAKVMVVLGTKPEYFKAVWVKNEWARYLALIRGGAKKMLIPAYKDMDPYDLPEEFSHLQAQDMTKLGFMQDLIRGIKKIIGSDQPQPTSKETVVAQQSAVTGNVGALIKRGNMALEDGEWQKADDFFEEVLNQDAECAEAYLGKLMSKCKRSNISSLTQYYISENEEVESEVLEACDEATSRIDDAVSSYMVLDYLSDNEIKMQYEFDRTYSSELSFREEQKEQELEELNGEKLLLRAQQYASGETKINIDKMIEEITGVLNKRISDAKQADDAQITSLKSAYEVHLNDADSKVKELYNNALEKQEDTYNSRVKQMNEAQTIFNYERVRDLFKSMHSYKDTMALADKCQLEIDKLKAEDDERLEALKKRFEAERIKKAKKKRRNAIVFVGAVLLCIAAYMIVTKIIIPNNNYNDAVELMNSEKYEEAITKFEALGEYKDSSNQINVCNEKIIEREYNDAVELMNSEKYEEAITKFEALGEYKDSSNRINVCKYNAAVALMNDGKYKEAIDIFVVLGDYEDSEKLLLQAELKLLPAASVGDIVSLGNYNGNTEWKVLDIAYGRMLVISKYALECRPYNTKNNSVSWRTCTLRTWLNGTYVSSAFRSEEQALIMPTNVVTVEQFYGTHDRTIDKVFLLSKDEATKYFTSDSDRQATLSDGESVFWWLRDHNRLVENSAYVTSNLGSCDNVVDYVDDTRIAVRPAMWIDISGL